MKSLSGDVYKHKKSGTAKGLGKELTKLNLISGLGFTIIANVLVGYLLGAFLDGLFSTTKIFKIIFIVLGTLSGVYNGITYIIKELERYDKIEKQKTEDLAISKDQEKSKDDGKQNDE
ncbi:AtpZ/AtpI family protein [Fervidobacterium islandicum]|uniref:AtpZ/AtpI family protein n=2 Tax=Fervidobacterium TaxID=2422 RepID=A0AAI8GCR0_FERIS|nr:AtpZ/AtpI family protein [Fervidobacterium islandicum]AMW32461.1 AtpZ/AtpI family protein [Fervidobacterium islandicum]QAV33959.1 hypothetical protein CBS1_09785 [Fervidobacterium changbaicum]